MQDIHPIKPAVGLTNLDILFFTSIMLLVIGFISYLVYKRYFQPRRSSHNYPPSPSYNQYDLDQNLEKASQYLSSNDIENYLDKASLCTRIYLSQKYNHDCIPLTTREITHISNLKLSQSEGNLIQQIDNYQFNKLKPEISQLHDLHQQLITELRNKY